MQIIDERSESKKIPNVGDVIELSNGTKLLVVKDSRCAENEYRVVNLLESRIYAESFVSLEDCVNTANIRAIIPGEKLRLTIRV